jgi:hypothetical protein
MIVNDKNIGRHGAQNLSGFPTALFRTSRKLTKLLDSRLLTRRVFATPTANASQGKSQFPLRIDEEKLTR